MLVVEVVFVGLLFHAGGLEVVYCWLLGGLTQGGLELDVLVVLFLVQGGELLELLLFLR